jgi:hypothetical protein
VNFLLGTACAVSLREDLDTFLISFADLADVLLRPFNRCPFRPAPAWR